MADATDFRILARLLRDPFASYESIGHDLELSGNTARNRIERLRTGGVIGGIWALPAPEVFQRHSRIFVFAPADRPSEALDAALRTDPVVWALERVDHRISVNAYLESPSDGPPEELVRLFGPPHFTVSPRIFSAGDGYGTLSPLDLRVLRALVRRPRASLQELGGLCHLTPKTVRAHRDAMFREGAFTMLTPLQGAQSRGLLVYSLFVLLPEITAALRGAVQAAIPDGLILSETEDPTGLYLLAHAASVGQALETETRMRAVRGVRHAELNLFLRHEFAAERIEGWIDDRLAMWERARRPA